MAPSVVAPFALSPSLVAVLAAWLCVAAASPAPPSTCPVVLPSSERERFHAPPSPSRHRVIGGIPVQPTTQSYLVSLSNRNNTFVCSGSLISPRWVLTAAHCQVTVQWRARLAPSSATSGSSIPIFRVINHPSYVFGRVDSPGDLALIQLATDAPLDTTTTIAINVNTTFPVAGSFARSSGYGRTRVHSGSSNPKPNQVDTPVNSPVRCRQIYRGYLDIRDNLFICAGYSKHQCHADSCNGDSGGPLVQYDHLGQPVQIGVTSFGLRCGDNGVPGVYIRLSSYIQWMAENSVEFTTSSSVIPTFAAGSSEAASDQPSTTIQDSQVGFPTFPRRKNTLVISTVWFAVICVIAAISLISLIILSLAYVAAGRRESSTTPSELPLPPNDSAPDSLPLSRHAAAADVYQHESVQRAILLLQSVINDVSQPSHNYSPDQHQLHDSFAQSNYAHSPRVEAERPAQGS